MLYHVARTEVSLLLGLLRTRSPIDADLRQYQARAKWRFSRLGDNSYHVPALTATHQRVRLRVLRASRPGASDPGPRRRPSRCLHIRSEHFSTRLGRRIRDSPSYGRTGAPGRLACAEARLRSYVRVRGDRELTASSSRRCSSTLTSGYAVPPSHHGRRAVTGAVTRGRHGGNAGRARRAGVGRGLRCERHGAVDYAARAGARAE